jgi:hypothetical protein
MDSSNGKREKLAEKCGAQSKERRRELGSHFEKLMTNTA